MNKTTNAQADAVATATNDAYSRDKYTVAAWPQIAREMAAAGFTPDQIEQVLRSKHMRWAADAANRRHSVTAADFRAYITKDYGGLNTPKFLQSMGAEFVAPAAKTGADLAGACEGEDIAEMIHVIQMLARGQALNEIGAARITDRAKDILATIERRAK